MERSGFFPYTEGDANSSYTAAFLAQYVASIVGNGVYASELGIAPGAGLSVTVASGRGWISGYYYRTDSPVVVPIQAAGGSQPRKDNIVLRLDIPNRVITAVAVRGTAASNPVAPALVRTTDIWELKLAEVTVPAGATSIAAANILDTRLDKTVCGIVTGVIDQMDATDFLHQMQAQFNAWMASIQNALDGDTAGNLLGLIQGVDTDLEGHAGSKDNPHSVTATQVGAVPTSRTVNGKALSSNISLTAADVGATAASHVIDKSNPHGVTAAQAGAAPASHASDTNNPHGVTADQAGAVPTSRTINGKALSGNVSLAAADVGAVPTSRTINGKALSGNISLTAADVGATASSHATNTSNPHGVTAAQAGAVPTSRTVNGKALSSNITLAAADVGAVPTGRTVNGKALSANISLTASDVGAIASGQSTLYGSTVPSTLAPGRIFVKI